jgi:hypothetical protein
VILDEQDSGQIVAVVLGSRIFQRLLYLLSLLGWSPCVGGARPYLATYFALPGKRLLLSPEVESRLQVVS